MWYLLNPRMWIATAIFTVLVFSHFTAYKLGSGIVRAQWNKDIAARSQQALKAEQQMREREQSLVIARNRSEERYVQEKRKAASAARSAQSALDGLRDELAARNRAASANPAPVAGANGAPGLEQELLGHCAAAFVGMAAEADRLETLIVGLQSYVKQVCQKQ